MTILRPAPFTDKQKRQHALRALEQRKATYPHLVAMGVMTEAEAREGIAVMRSIVADYILPDGGGDV